MGFVRNLTGANQAKAAEQSGDLLRAAGKEAQGIAVEAGQEAQTLFDPLAGLATRGVEESSFLANPQAQFDFLQSNPLFQMGLDNVNEQTMKIAAMKGRLGAGDTLQQLNQNALLAATPLLNAQRQDIGALLGVGGQAIGNQAQIGLNQSNLGTDYLTGGESAKAAGVMGAAQAKTAGAQGGLNLAIDVGKMIAGLPPSGTAPASGNINTLAGGGGASDPYGMFNF